MIILIPESLLRPEVESEDECFPVVESDFPVVDSDLEPVVVFRLPAVVAEPVVERLPVVRLPVADVGGVIDTQEVSL